MLNLSKCYLKIDVGAAKNCMIISEDGLSWNKKSHGS